jgi:5'-methylthioadenosine phosphorylase
MKEEIPPLDLVVPDQIFDRTVARTRTFFGDSSGIVGHIPFAEPFCQTLRPILREVSEASGATIHYGGTYICIEGPQFSTRGESNIYRQWGVDVIGMTAIPEAKLAREAEMHYVLLACATDYDCWHESHESVTVEMVVQNLHKNVGRAKEVIRRFVPLAAALKDKPVSCGCDTALATAIMTDRRLVPPASVEKLGLLVQKYF